jgi:two-component system, OmpR family, KDP operon response regulator KdpE
MERQRILLIEAAAETRGQLHTVLTHAGFQVTLAASGHEGLDQAALLSPTVILLDLLLPDLDGLQLCRELRSWCAAPLIVISTNNDVQLKVQALNLGADDYIIKPFDAEEIIARLRAVLRRTGREAVAPILENGALRLDQAHRRVTVTGREVPLTPTEYELLKYLMTHAGKVITYPTLLRVIWGDAYTSAYATLRVFIAQLRRKIEPDHNQPSYIVTEARIGYRFRSNVEPSAQGAR